MNPLSGFTMAEILLSLTIIGVVAAITLPSLTGNINERTWNTQRKALYARMSQAFALMPALNSFGTLKEVEQEDGTTSIEDNAAETFITNGLSKVLKINNICDADHLADCGIPAKFSRFDAASTIEVASINTLTTFNDLYSNSNKFKNLAGKAAAFETQNGESILLYYNPFCRDGVLDANNSLNYVYMHDRMCVNMVYDLNGNKGPNQVGKDIGVITVLKPVDPVVTAPMLAVSQSKLKSAEQFNAGKVCTSFGTDIRIATMDEGVSFYVNRKLLALDNDFWTGDSVIDSDNAYVLGLGYYSNYTGTAFKKPRTTKYYPLCVKR